MRRRILLVVLAATSMVAVAFAVPLAAPVWSVAEDRAVDAAAASLARLAPLAAVAADAGVEDAVAEAATAQARPVALWLPDGTVVGDPGPVPEEAVGRSRATAGAFRQQVAGGMAVLSPVVVGTGEVVVASTVVPTHELRRGVARAWLFLAALAGALIIGALAVADRMARSLVAEARRLQATAAALAEGEVSARVPETPTRELRDAGATLNRLADRIDALRQAERERVADLSHRLRTPLTSLRLSAEATGDPDLSADVARLEADVTAIIRAARRPLRDELDPRTVDLLAVVEERLAHWAPAAEDAGRRWRLVVTDDAVDRRPHVPVERGELEAALDAVLANVFAHTPDGTPYAVSVDVDGDGGVTLAVDDQGEGFADPVAALERGRGRGTGLGLDIVRRTAEDAGGQVTLGRSPEDGARVTLRLPAEARSGTSRPR